MNTELLLAVVFRWLHVASAVALAGGLLFLAVVVAPAARDLFSKGGGAVPEAISGRFKAIVIGATVLLLGSGFYNFFTISLDKAEGVPAYHGLFGVKFLLALVVFFFGAVLTGRAPAFAGMRAAMGRWAGIAAAVAFVVILISAILKNLG